MAAKVLCHANTTVPRLWRGRAGASVWCSYNACLMLGRKQHQAGTGDQGKVQGNTLSYPLTHLGSTFHSFTTCEQTVQMLSSSIDGAINEGRASWYNQFPKALPLNIACINLKTLGYQGDPSYLDHSRSLSVQGLRLSWSFVSAIVQKLLLAVPGTGWHSWLSGGKNSIVNKWCWENCVSTWWRMKTRSISLTLNKNSKWIKNLN